MKIMHFHFGKNGGAERFFVLLVNALKKRGVSQKAIIRPNQIWRKEIERAAEIGESHFRNASIDRVLLPFRVKRAARRWKPDALFAWMPRVRMSVEAEKREVNAATEPLTSVARSNVGFVRQWSLRRECFIPPSLQPLHCCKY